MEVRENSGRNPIIIISDVEVMEWLRQKVDEAGFADRTMCDVQTQIEGGALLLHGCPQITLMVSNIKDSYRRS
jgi:hypothetical protein